MPNRKKDPLITNYLDPDAIIETVDGPVSALSWLKKEKARIGNCHLDRNSKGEYALKRGVRK